MISRQAVVLDPLSSAKECKSPASICSEEGRGNNESSLAASFVFVESQPDNKILQRHATVVHHPSPSQEEDDEYPLIDGEEKQALIHRVSLIHPAGNGEEIFSLLITNYRIVVVDSDLWIPLTSVLDVKVGQRLDIKTKDCRFFQFNIGDESGRNSLIKLLNKLIFSISPNELMPLHRQVKNFAQTSVRILNLEKELTRLVGSPSADDFKIKISNGNADFSVCPTYPRLLIVPECASKENLIGCSKFRDKGRIPVLSWISSTSRGGAIWRSSQPKSSILNRSGEDEEYLKQAGIMFIIDCRPMLNAYANIANGAGVESLGNYHKGIELWFAGIHNIHHVRESWEKTFILAQQYYAASIGGGGGWLVGLENTGWLEYIQSILKAASVLAEKVSLLKIPVLCRCSHGLDRTSQVVSLAMLAIDPYYRTIEGFGVLIEKEWIAMGHRFHSRYCIGEAPHDDVSPIFSQWIECVYQLVVQYPDEFEFTPQYLVAILFGVLSGRFSNFLFDSDKERSEHGLDGEMVTDCIWAELWKHKSKYENLNYQERKSGSTLEIDYRISSLQLFTKLWLSPSRINF